MNVNAVVELHQEYLDVPHSLPENFGDGYLCEHNRIYRNIRKQGVSCGTTYSLGGNSRWFDYMVFPLVNFDELINSKEIPYIDNYSVLLRLSQKYPKMTLPEKFIRDAFKRNYLLHETCHCIAHDFLLKETKNSQKISEEKFSKSVKLLNCLLGEAFANSIELISSAAEKTSIHIFLHVLNSYVPYSPKTQELVHKATGEIGVEKFLKLSYASFFFNNLLGYEHSEANVKKLLDEFYPYFEFDNKKREIVAEAIYKCARLNPRFRDETSVIFFDSFGLGNTYKNLSSEKVLKNPALIKNVAKTAHQLCDLILEAD